MGAKKIEVSTTNEKGYGVPISKAPPREELITTNLFCPICCEWLGDGKGVKLFPDGHGEHTHCIRKET